MSECVSAYVHVYVCAYVCVCVYERALTTGAVGEVLPLHTEACFLARLSGLSEHRAGHVRESRKADIRLAAMHQNIQIHNRSTWLELTDVRDRQRC